MTQELNNPSKISIKEDLQPFISEISVTEDLQSFTNKISVKKDLQSFINEISIISSKKSKTNKWKQNAITVAGGNGEGQQLNQCSSPQGIFIDYRNNIFIADNQNHRIVAWKCNAKQGQELNRLNSPRGIFTDNKKHIFTTDYWNHRVSEWKYNAKRGQIIAGGNGEGNRRNQLNAPTDVVVDQEDHSIIIADRGNRRVIRRMNQNQQVLIRNIDCFGLAMDKYGFLYVSDDNRNEVRRWKREGFDDEEIVVAGGNGEGNQLNQLHRPTFIFVDEDQSVYISDSFNHRVMKWRRDAKEGIIVAGGNDKGSNLNQLHRPQGVIVDNLGQIYVADFRNHRVMRWCEGKGEGEIIVRGNGEANLLYLPMGLSFDDERNLYVAAMQTHRIQKFEIIL
ncbi:unnamed protein product [Adineta steineri]|uniref:NHL repeat containing protein n=1 Tax=Adineta steineri TaxID=433720 RepID=A0A814AL34_9BILA|nr:unnamed protein product [Adineta steineri]CAF0913461.1 unnamed protein product [Adineta steineri]